MHYGFPSAIVFLFSLALLSCKNKQPQPLAAAPVLNLKRGAVVTCGPAGEEFGTVGFASSCPAAVKKDFALAVALLHSFEYDEAEKAFAKVIDGAPNCPMGYWGVAMSNYHPLWAPPTEPELQKGAAAVALAQSLPQASDRETAYVNAIAAFYTNWEKDDHRTRAVRYRNAMEKLSRNYPADKEATALYALSLTAAADPADQSFAAQKKAGALLRSLYPGQPNHPGIVHYIIHSYDAPELAPLGLEAARKYASVAPSSAHALHMPSHIFTRLGLWDECIRSNRASVSSAQCYAQQTGIKGHWDEELHGLDYLVYAHLQKGENGLAKKRWDDLKSMDTVSPVNFKVLYATAAIPARYLLENRFWLDAANLTPEPAHLPWKSYPWQRALIHFTRALGAAHTGQLTKARAEVSTLDSLRKNLLQQKDPYKAAQVAVQQKAAEAWLWWKEGKHQKALAQMTAAADLEDKTEKHPVTPCEVLPARELLGDMLLQTQKPAEALAVYEAGLKSRPNRFNGLLGAATAAEKIGAVEKANRYYTQLLAVANSKEANRPELLTAKQFLHKKKNGVPRP